MVYSYWEDNGWTGIGLVRYPETIDKCKSQECEFVWLLYLGLDYI